MIRVKRFENSVFSSNTFVIDDGFNAVIIDIGDFKPIFNYIKNMGLNVAALLITHAHYDHIYGVKNFITYYPNIPIYTSEFGKEAFAKPNWNFSRYHEDEISIESNNIKVLSDREILYVSHDIRINVIATPGHDMSCLSYKIEDNLFTGDSYIPGINVVATFPKSNKLLAKEWYSRLKEWSADFNIYSGHGIPLLKK